MFYAQDILQKRGGKFGIIWLAATEHRGIKLTRREVCSVDVRKSCDDIIDYILLRAPPARTGGSRPRLSLYLSSQLMYGVVRIFRKQQDYLYNEASQCLLKVRLMAATCADIDLHTEISKNLVTFPEENFDYLSEDLLQDVFEVPSPIGSPDLFRLSPSILESPSLSSVAPQESSLGSPKTRVTAFRPLLGSPHTVSSIDQITLKEEVGIPEIQMDIIMENDLPTFDGKELDKILAEPIPEELLSIEDLMPTSTPHPQRIHKHPSVTAEESPILPAREKTPSRHPPIDEPPERHKPVPPTPALTPKEKEVTPRRVRPSLSFELSPVTPSPARRRRRRKLHYRIVDKDIQIAKDEIRLQLQHGSGTTEPLVLPSTKQGQFTAERLLNRPGTRQTLVHKSLLELWTRNAYTRRGVPAEELEIYKRTATGEIIESPPRDADLGVEIPMEQGQDTMLAEQPAADASSIEVGRDATLGRSSSQLRVDESSISLQQVPSDVEISREAETSATKRPRRKRTRGETSSEEEADLIPPQKLKVPESPSLVEAPSVSDRDSRALYDVPEEHEPRTSLDLGQVPILESDLDNLMSDVSVGDNKEAIREALLSEVRREKWTTFRQFCPPLTTNKAIAAKRFTVLLEMCKRRDVIVTQKEAYDEIYIRPSQGV